MANLFRSNRRVNIRRNPFNLSHDVKLTSDFGRLTPILFKEVVPNDTFRLRSEMLIRTAPLYAPLMHRVNAYVHYFFVPSRLVMDNFDVFISGGEDGDDKIKPRFETAKTVHKPHFLFSDLVDNFQADKQALYNMFGNGSLWDYLGFPALSSDDIDLIFSNPNNLSLSDFPVDMLPFFVYNLVYNEYYRDENFEDKVEIFKDVNGDLMTYLGQAVSQGKITSTERGNLIWDLFRCKQRNWEKDYFTSALPFPQRGGDTVIATDISGLDIQAFPGGNVTVTNNQFNSADVASKLSISGTFDQVSINELRRALAIQKFKERMARYGVRYTEFLRGVFGVSPADATLQRPEFLGGFKQQLQFGEVLQTSETTSESPQGAYAGTGFSLTSGKYIKAHFKEHGYIIGILSIMPKPAYMQQFPRELRRFTKFDYFIPDFAHLGEQMIDKAELRYVPARIATGATTADMINYGQFGYIPRYSEYKFAASRVCGEMRTTLDYWHLARRISPGQQLNKVFLESHQDELDRVFNYTGDTDDDTPHALSVDDHFWLQVYHDIKAIRPMPKFGTPLI